MAVSVVTGDKAIDRKLAALGDKAARRVGYAAIRSGLVVAKAGIKSEIPGHQKSVRKAIGSRFAKSKGGSQKGVMVGKVGGAVGAKNGRKEKERGEGRPGVGISANNIHWILIGTGERQQDSTGRATGKMETQSYVPAGFKKSEGAIRTKMLQRLNTLIAKEIIKQARGK